MKQLARALVHQRMSYPALRSLITFHADIDPQAADRTYPFALLSVLVQPSEVFAVVPFVCTETVYAVADELLGNTLQPHTPGRGLADVVDLLVYTLKGKAWFGKEASIHRQTFAGLVYEADAGGMHRARITWQGEASWVLRRGAGL